MAARIAWILNLDADLELGAPERYTPKRSVIAAMGANVPALAASLLQPGDVVIDDSSAVGAAQGFLGRAFCPTPRALRLLERAGAVPEPHPPVDVLRRVNSRAFCSALGATLPHAAFFTDLGEARATLAEAPRPFELWRVKRAFGMTGRGQRVIAPHAISIADQAFVRAGVEAGGVQIEPHVEIVREVAIHGVLCSDGTSSLGRLVRQRCDARGAWIATEPFEPIDAGDHDLVEKITVEAGRVAEALAGAHYFGPFGVDAYTYREPGDIESVQLQPRSEINARYSMGFAVGLGRESSSKGMKLGRLSVRACTPTKSSRSP